MSNEIVSYRYAMIDDRPALEVITYQQADATNEGDSDPRYRELKGREGRWIWVQATNLFADIPADADDDHRFGTDGEGVFGLPLRPDVKLITKAQFEKAVNKVRAEDDERTRSEVLDMFAVLGAQRDAKAAALKKAGIDPSLFLDPRPEFDEKLLQPKATD